MRVRYKKFYLVIKGSEKMMLKNIEWDNSQIYTNFDAPQIDQDLQKIKQEISFLRESSLIFNSSLKDLEAGELADDKVMESAREITARQISLNIQISTIMTFANCRLSTNSQHPKAKELYSKTAQARNDLTTAVKPLDVFLKLAPQTFIAKYLKDKRVLETHFQVEHARKLSAYLLPTSEEILANNLSQHGLDAWGDLYSAISGRLKVIIDGDEFGLAQANGFLRGGDRELRAKAWKAINEAWSKNEESASAVLNALNGWRLDMNKSRSHTKDLHYLDVSCHTSRISRDTLNALIETTYKKREVGHLALNLMAKAMGVQKLHPSDLLAPAPVKSNESAIPFDEAIELIAEAFSEFDPDMGSFAKMMAEKRWIDSNPSENRSSGAYCTGFAREREPRVFITYTGSMGDVITLAHELGHAYHNWVMRDLPWVETHYSMTLAETASIFAETLVKEALLKRCKTKEEKLNIHWQNAESAAAMLLNIPARFEFEKNLVEARKERTQTPQEMKVMMSSAWEKWYGDSIQEYDSMFWASKLHFSISSLGFYNYPYLFGYLFSLGIYKQKEKLKGSFKQMYIDLLRDTGTMTAEDLIKKHLNEDISTSNFWQQSLDIVEKQVLEFKLLIDG
jgi:oligoendopeptidase F